MIGQESVPAIVRELDDDAATLLMVDSNLQREQLLPSERAYAFKMKLDALKHQGRRASPTSAQVGQKLNTSIEKVAEKIGESKTQVQRYIRLTHLIPQLLQMVDDRQLAFSPAVELSFLTKQEQVELLDAMDSEQSHPFLSQAQRLRKLSESDSLSIIQMRNILSEEKANAEKVAMDYADFRDYFPPKTTDRQIHKVLISSIQGGPMAERKTPTYSFSRRLGYTHYDVDVTCDPNAKVTYEDRLLELIRNLPPADHHPPEEPHEDQRIA